MDIYKCEICKKVGDSFLITINGGLANHDIRVCPECRAVLKGQIIQEKTALLRSLRKNPGITKRIERSKGK